MQNSYKEQMQKQQIEFERLSQKYEQKRRAVKDLETEIGRLNTQNDRDRAVFNEKLANAESKILSLEKKSIDELEDLKIQMEERSNNYLRDI